MAVHFCVLLPVLAPADLVSTSVGPVNGRNLQRSSGSVHSKIHSKAFHFFNPARFFALIAYIFVFFWEMVKANLSMVGIVLTGKRNHCQSGIIRVPADKGLTSEYGLAMISNCITMTPGTITVDVAEDEEGNNYYYVHWIDVAEMDREKAGDIIKGTMEKWIGRIWK